MQGATDRMVSGHAGGSGRAASGEQGDPDERAHTRSRSLSRREVGILEELAMGTSTDEIAAKLHVSPHTVRTHIKNIMRKLDARTRAHAVAIAYSEHAIDPFVYAD